MCYVIYWLTYTYSSYFHDWKFATALHNKRRSSRCRFINAFLVCMITAHVVGAFVKDLAESLGWRLKNDRFLLNIGLRICRYIMFWPVVLDHYSEYNIVLKIEFSCFAFSNATEFGVLILVCYDARLPVLTVYRRITDWDAAHENHSWRIGCLLRRNTVFVEKQVPKKL